MLILSSPAVAMLAYSVPSTIKFTLNFSAGSFLHDTSESINALSITKSIAANAVKQMLFLIRFIILPMISSCAHIISLSVIFVKQKHVSLQKMGEALRMILAEIKEIRAF